MANLRFILAVAFAAVTPAFASIGPERVLPVSLGEVMAVASDGRDFLVAYHSPFPSPGGLHLQRIGPDGEPLGGPLRMTNRLPRRVEIAATRTSVAVAWTECINSAPCTLFVSWIDAAGLSAAPSILHTSLADFAIAEALDDDGIFVAWKDFSVDTTISLSLVRRSRSAFEETETIVIERHASIGALFLASNDTEMLLGWQQVYATAIGPNAAREQRLKVRFLDGSGQPFGPVLAPLYNLVETFEAAGPDEFIILGSRDPYDHRHVTRLRGGAVVSDMRYLQGVPTARASMIGEAIFAANIRDVPGDDRNNSYLTVTRGGIDTTFTLTSDPTSHEVGIHIARSDDRLIVVYETESRVDPTRRIAYRIVDEQGLNPRGPAPSSLRVRGSTSGSVGLEWDPVPGAVAYRIIESIVDDPTHGVEHVVGGDETFISIELRQPETSYAFQLIVEDATGLSQPSAAVVFRTGISPWPRAPLNVTATAGSNRTVTLRWTDVSSNEDGFKIVWGSGIQTFVIVPPNTTEATIQVPSDNVFPLHVVAFRGGLESYSDPVVVEVGEPRPRRRAVAR